MNNLKIETVPVAELRTYDKNAKIHNDEQVRQIANSIERFGFNNPILIDETGEIIAGHGRYMAAQLLGMIEIPAIRLAHLTDVQKRAYRLADNKISEAGGWDENTLKLELAELDLISDDLDITDTGFSTLEIDVLLDEKPEKDKLDEKANTVSFVPDNEIVSKIGDLWLLGGHRLLCGSSLDDANFKRLMDGKLADLILQDPPYNISAKTIGLNGKHQHPDFKMAAGEMSHEEFTKFLTDNFTLCSKYSNKNALSYQWMDWCHIREITVAGDAAFGSQINLCVWSKPSGGIGKLYRPRHELCFVFNNGDKQYGDNVDLGKFGRFRTNVWEYTSVGAFGAHKNDTKYHPTVKPYEMFKDIILDASPRGGIVLDSFVGSGTSLIAADKSKRTCYGMDIDPKYVDTAIRRFQDMFGIDAIHAETGKTYNEMLNDLKAKGTKND